LGAALTTLSARQVAGAFNGVGVDDQRTGRPDVESQCPRFDAVWSALQPVAGPSIASAPSIALADLGDGFRVSVNGQQREYHDPARDCARRSRLAAVFSAIALGLPPPTAAIEDEVALRPPAGARPARPPFLVVEVGGATEAGLAAGYRVTLVGAGARAVLGGGRWKLVLGAALLAAGDAVVAPLAVGYTHAPFDLGVRVDGRAGRLEGSFEAGAAAGLLWLHAAGVVHPRNDLVFEWGGGVSALVRYRAWAHAAPFIAGGGRLVAAPADLYVPPRGSIGQAPRLWLEASAGASVAF
jgi:hypothetical protein